MQPYVNYREFCTDRKYKSFEDLEDAISPERIYRLRRLYKDVEDVELMSGLWVEKYVAGGMVPHTIYCLLADQLKRSIISDRHWYESSTRPHAFTLEQLQSIRKTTIAGVLCAVGDEVTEIQPAAFQSISNKNPLTKCSSSDIGALDLSAWEDPMCS
ncbi:peroxidase-like [Trichoplusia ni]|uniref:Peroxidase-like n=1 Tax=Trichoplusia ni TaxID=7111 RepID=A0A7E5WHF2_TRINI|nr:peroxidase-like [Trichoplusia ni]